MSDSENKPKQANPAADSLQQKRTHQGLDDTANIGQTSVSKNDIGAANPAADVPATDVSEGRVSTSSSPSQILIAEDEYLIAASIRDALMRYDKPLNVVVVQRSNMLVDNINNLKPDVLLMDITLKGAMDGIEAIQYIKESGRDIPVVYITADSRITTLERAETTNPVAYLIKPFREADLHKALAKALALLED